MKYVVILLMAIIAAPIARENNVSVIVQVVLMTLGFIQGAVMFNKD